MAVVGAGQQFGCTPQLHCFLAIEVRQVDFDEVAEALVGQQDFGARVDTAHPRTATLALDEVDEAGFGAARFLHHVEQTSDVIAGRLGMEGHGVVGLLAVEVVMDPEVLLGLGEVYPFGIAIRNERNFSRAA